MRRTFKVFIPTAAASLLLAACGSSSSSSSVSAPAAPATPAVPSSGGLIKTASDSQLGATILVNAQGMTLYHLTGEQDGRWICTSAACVKVWHPLKAPSGGALTGASSLGTVKRPDGTTQVTYKGLPLYTFAQDTKPGDASGQGVKDVGTWMAATTGASSTAATSKPAAPAPTSSSGGGYGY